MSLVPAFNSGCPPPSAQDPATFSRRPGRLAFAADASQRPGGQRGISLHAQIPFPVAAHRTAAVAVDRLEEVDQKIQVSTLNAVRRAMAVRAYAAASDMRHKWRNDRFKARHEWGSFEKVPVLFGIRPAELPIEHPSSQSAYCHALCAAGGRTDFMENLDTERRLITNSGTVGAVSHMGRRAVMDCRCFVRAHCAGDDFYRRVRLELAAHPDRAHVRVLIR